MIKTEMIDKLTSKTMSSRGRRLYEAGHVYNLTVQKEHSYTRISAEVERFWMKTATARTMNQT